MPTPNPRTKITIGRGSYANLLASLADLAEGEIVLATDESAAYVKLGGQLVQITSEDMVTSVNGKVGDVVLDKGDIGLGSADNTSDVDKPVSTATQAALDDKADLVNGVVPNSQLPSIAVSTYLGLAADEAAMLALEGEKADWCVRTDLSNTWIVTGDDSSEISGWTELATPADLVTSVNGYQGAVVLSAADVGAIPSTDSPNFAPSTLDLQGVTDNGTTTTRGATFGSVVNGTQFSASLSFQLTRDSGAQVTIGGSDTYAVWAKDDAFVLKHDGSATFAGNVTSTDGTNHSSIRPGYMVISSPADFGQVIGCYTGSSYSWDISAAGDATFSGVGTFGGDLRVQDGGNFRVRTAGNAAQDAILLQNTGAASFAGGQFDIDSSGVVQTNIKSAGKIQLDSSASFNDPKIELNSVNGSATFAGTLTVDENINGLKAISGSGTGSTPVVRVYSDTLSKYTTNLNADGSASFAGTVISGGNPANGAARGTSINEYGTVRAANTSGSIFEGYTVGTAAATSQIYASGAAEFKSQLSSGNVGGSGYRQGFLCVPDGDGSYVQVYGKNGDVTPTFSIYNGDLADNVATIDSIGNATFAQTVTTGGTLNVANTSSAGNAIIIGNNNQTVLESNGAGTFAGTVVAGAGTYTGAGTAISQSGNIYIQGTPTDVVNDVTAISVVNPTDYNSPNVTITHAGAATFAGSVTSGGDPNNGVNVGCKLYGTQGTVGVTTGNSAINVWAGYSQGTTTPTSSITGAGAATFAGRVNCGNNTVNDVAIKAENNTSSVATIYAQQFNDSGSVWSGRDKNNIETSKIGVAGNAVFGTGYKVGIRPFDGDTADQLYIDKTDGTRTFSVLGNGTATFAGDLICANSTIRAVTSSGHGLLRVLNSSFVDTAYIDGSTGDAKFDGLLTAKNGATFWRTANSVTCDLQTSATSDSTYILRGKSGVASSGASGGDTKFFITAAGNASFDGTVSAQGTVLTSDAKFKTDITDASSQLDDVVALGNSLRNWNWTDEAPIADKETRFLGLIAQEAEEICPGVVAELGEGGSAYKGIKNDVLVMKLLGAVAELTARVEELESR